MIAVAWIVPGEWGSETDCADVQMKNDDLANLEAAGGPGRLILKIGTATLPTALCMPAMVAMRHNPAVAALVARLRGRGRLKGKQIVVAAMRKLLVICFGVLKSGKPFDAALALPA
jgi:hypothetical protein